MDFCDVFIGKPRDIHFHWCGYFQSVEPWNHDERINLDFELMIITEGVLKLSVEDKKIELYSGNMLLIPPHTHFVGFGDEAGVEFYWIHFEAVNLELKGKLASDEPPSDKAWQIPVLADQLLLDNELFLFQQMQTIKQMDFSDTSLLDAYLFTLLLSISEKYQRPTYLNKDKHYLIDYIKSYLQWNYQRNITIEEIANYFGYNKAYISNLFSREAGETITQYLNTLRLESARQALLTTNLSIREIANSNGFGSAAVTANPGTLVWPVNFSFGAYAKVFDHPLILSGFKNSLLIIIISLPINIVLTLFCAYFMASKNILFKKPIIFYMLFTMFFNGGLIPSFLNQRSLGLVDTLWALIIPSALSLFNAIICKTAIESIPESLTESANIDGANDFTILFRIVAPVIMPTIAVLLLFYGVGHWNSWFSATLYISKNELLPIQNILRAVLIANNKMFEQAGSNSEEINNYAETIKYAAVVITTLPILCIYPFLQRYFVKGVMIGAVKG